MSNHLDAQQQLFLLLKPLYEKVGLELDRGDVCDFVNSTVNAATDQIEEDYKLISNENPFVGNGIMWSCDKNPDIDPLMIDIIKELNSKNYTTHGCCQGRTIPGDSHCKHAFIGFTHKISARIRRIAEDIYNIYPVDAADNSLATPVYSDTPDEEAIELNAEFRVAIRELFLSDKYKLEVE